jgi:tetratricopeptide (TPR) repeat protein
MTGLLDKLLGKKTAKEWLDKGIAFLNSAYRGDVKEMFGPSGLESDKTYLKQYKKAIECFDMALKIDQTNADAWYRKGSALYSIGCELDDGGKFKEAIKCFDTALKIDPMNADAWHIKGLALRLLGRDKEASECSIKSDKIYKRYERLSRRKRRK